MEKQWFVSEETKKNQIDKHTGENNYKASNVYWDGKLFFTLGSLCEHLKMSTTNFHYHRKKGNFVLVLTDEKTKWNHPIKKLEIKGKIEDYQRVKLLEIINGTLVCSKCKQVKKVGEFTPNKNKRTGYAYFCKKCHSELYYKRKTIYKEIVDGKQQCGRCREWKLLENFSPSNQTRNGYVSVCKDCFAVYRKEHPEKQRNTNLKIKYGITEEQYQEILKSQNGGCAICGKPEAENRHKKLHVDHDHNTGKVRSLLCSNCNSSLGLIGESKDRLQLMMDYIDKHNSDFSK